MGTKLGVIHTVTGETTATYQISDTTAGVTGWMAAGAKGDPNGRGRGVITGEICKS